MHAGALEDQKRMTHPTGPGVAGDNEPLDVRGWEPGPLQRQQALLTTERALYIPEGSVFFPGPPPNPGQYCSSCLRWQSVIPLSKPRSRVL